MARGSRGSVVWHCSKCGNMTSGSCEHPGAKYYAVYWVGDKQKWEPVSRNRKETEKRLTQVLAQIDQGRYSILKPILFRDFAEQWLRDYGQGHLKPLTFRSYKGQLRNHMVPAFGDSMLAELTVQSIQGFLSRCRRERQLSAKSTNY